MQEVEKIISEGSALKDLNKFMKEVDLLDLDLGVGCDKVEAQNNETGNDINLFEFGQSSPSQPSNNGSSITKGGMDFDLLGGQ